TGIRIGWTDARTFAFQGTVKTAGGVDLDADLTLSPDDWHLRRLRFSDGSSQVNASARQSADSLTLDFSGNVEKATADRILADNRTLSGGLEGDFQVVVDSRNPMSSAFTGKLSGRGLHLRALLPDTVDIDHFAVEGSGDRMRIAPARLTWRESHLEVTGVVASGEGGLTVDLQVDADKLDADAIRTLGNVSPDDGGSDAPSEGGPSMAAQGRIQLDIAEFSYEPFIWSPVEAEMRLNGKTMDIRIDRADLCGIATTGSIALSSDGVNVQIDPSASDASLQATADCLLTRPIRAEARYDLSGRITLPASRTDPIRAMTGRVEFSSRNGKIIHGNILMKILSVLNLTEVFAGAGSDLAEKGYGYETAHVAADIGDGKMMFEEILFDGKSLKITGQGRIDLVDRMVDVTLLAAPLKTVDRIVNKIPVISYIAGGSLVSIPLHLKGKMDNLTVVPMSPSAVGKGLLNIMGRTLKDPFKLVEGAAEFASEAGGATNQPPKDTRQKGP
ncbi:MAG TPA: AsmA-like C-terminal domain-containing protein, partial [Desulfosarcina sp.]|nr:AsmA-like C-terminal domain-containing protein [Desulfosarcina sp.]